MATDHRIGAFGVVVAEAFDQRVAILEDNLKAGRVYYWLGGTDLLGVE